MKTKKYFILIFLASWQLFAKNNDEHNADSRFLRDIKAECFTIKELTEAKKLQKPLTISEINPSDFILWKGSQFKKEAPSKRITSMKMLSSQLDYLFKNPDQPVTGIQLKDFLMRIDNTGLISILTDLLYNPALLEQVSKRSYVHVMNFTKIVLVDGPKDRNFKLRLHIWWPGSNPNSKKMIVEDKHAHKWNFASRMMTGFFEDQLFTEEKVDLHGEHVFTKLTDYLARQSAAENKKIIDSLQTLELAYYAHSISKDSLCVEDPSNMYSRGELEKRLQLTDEELEILFKIHRRYVTEPNRGGEYGLKEMGLTSLNAPRIMDIEANDIYYHHNTVAHRLISRANEVTSTILITAIPIESKEPYIMMRSNSGEEETKVAPFTSSIEISKQIRDYIALLQKQH